MIDIDNIIQIVNVTLHNEDAYKIQSPNQFFKRVAIGSKTLHYSRTYEINANHRPSNIRDCMSEYDTDLDMYQFVYDTYRINDDERFSNYADYLEHQGAMSLFLYYEFDDNLLVMYISSLALFEDISSRTIVNLSVYEKDCIDTTRTNYRFVLTNQEDYMQDLQLIFAFLYDREKYLMYLSKLNTMLKKTLNSSWLKDLLSYYRKVYNEVNR